MARITEMTGPPRVPRDQHGCGGCLAYLAVTLADLALLFWAAADGNILIASGAVLLLWLVMGDARRYRGIT